MITCMVLFGGIGTALVFDPVLQRIGHDVDTVNLTQVSAIGYEDGGTSIHFPAGQSGLRTIEIVGDYTDDIKKCMFGAMGSETRVKRSD